MLTEEILKNNIEGLNDEQAKAALKLLSNRIGQIHGEYEHDFEIAFGKKKPSGMKTYDFLKEEVATLNEKASTNGAQISEQLKALQEENKKLKEGQGDETLKAQLAEKESLIEQLKSGFQERETELKTLLENQKKEAVELEVSKQFDLAFSGLKRKESISDSVQRAAYNAAIGEIRKDAKPAIENGKLVFKDAEGKTLLNKEKGLEPYTAADLLKSHNAIKDLIAEEKPKNGAGTGATVQNGKTIVGVGDAKTRVQATEAIRSQLFAEGLSTSDPVFQERFNEAYKENNVSALPIK